MTRTIFIAAALALAVTLPAVSAQAQSPRTFVSAAGSDSNPCSFAAPCRHFQAAVTATSAGGEVDALDPAGYGPITITQAITIEGQGWSYIAPPAGGNGITINAIGAADKISIHGVSLNGVGITGPTIGIQFNSGASLTVRDSVIRNFTGQGIAFQTNASTPSNISVLNTLISDNGGIGIFIVPAGSGMTTGVIDHVQVDNSTNNGIEVATTTATINVTISDSLSTHSANQGIICPTGGSAPINIMVRNSAIVNNVADGLFAGNNCIIRVTRSTITGNNFGWVLNGSGVVSSYSDNNIDGNSSGANSEPPNALVYH